MNSEETIDNKYIIKEKKGKGATAYVFLVEEQNTQKIYASKVLNEPSDLFNKEIEILNALKNINNPYIVNIIDSGTGPIIRANRPTTTSQYIVLEYAPKGDILKYIQLTQSGLGEKYSKVIFRKILKGVQACHNANICHRDLKMENILFDEQFNPKICDFGFATFYNNNILLKDFIGTETHAAPEVLLHRPYNGFKDDIFSLGVILFTLVTSKNGFIKATKSDLCYRQIIKKRDAGFWIFVTSQIPEISDKLKKLYLKMVSYEPQDRPSIEDILNDDWFQEIRDLDIEQLTQLENEIREELLKREQTIQKKLKKEIKTEGQSYSSNINMSGNRCGDDEKEYFDLSLTPKLGQDGIGMNNYIKIKGKLNPAQFMNSLANKLENEFGDNCNIDPAEKALKFDILFEEEKEEEEEIPKELEEELAKLGLEDVEENDDDLQKKDCIIQVKLFESINGGHLLRFVKKSGELEDYYKNLEKIMSLTKEIL